MSDVNDLSHSLRKSVTDVVTTELKKEKHAQTYTRDDNYIPTVVLVGITDVGKSLLITSLFGNLDDEQVWAKTLKLIECSKCDQTSEETIKQILDSADLVVHVYSVYTAHQPVNTEIAKFIHESGKHCLIVLNKCDPPGNFRSDEWTRRINEIKEKLGRKVTCVSAKTGEGLNDLVVNIFLSLPEKLRPRAIVKLISQVKRTQTNHIKGKDTKNRQEACNKIISEALLKVGVMGTGENVGNDLLSVYEDMVKQIVSLYLEDTSPGTPPAPKFAFMYEELIRGLAKQVPIVGPIFGQTIGQVNAWVCIYFLGKRTVNFYEKCSKEGEPQMAEQKDVLKEIERHLEARAKSLKLPEPEKKALTRDALLTIGTFLGGRAPIITFTGASFSGKSSLINRLFDQKITEEGMTSDTTNVIIEIRFRSGLLIYDTPGASGTKAELENITRAYLGLEQLKKDVRRRDTPHIDKIPVIDARNYNKKRNGPIVFREHKDFTKSDLYIFVLNCKNGAVAGGDIPLYEDMLTLGKPIIIVLNKVDDESEELINDGLFKIKEEFGGENAIALSAKTGENINELVNTIAGYLPPECSASLGQTINEQHHNLVREQGIGLYSLITAIKMAHLFGKGANRTVVRQLVLHVLCLYGLIISRYNLNVTDDKLKQAGVSLSDVLDSFKEKEKRRNASPVGSKAGLLALTGTVVGVAIGGVLTAGAAIPVVLGAVASGAAIGAPSGALVGTLDRFLDRWQASDVEEEFQQIEEFISTAKGYDTAASIFAFGRSLSKCCNKLEEGKTDVDFSQIFQHEHDYALEKLKPFSEQLNKKWKELDDQDKVIRKIVENVLMS